MARTDVSDTGIDGLQLERQGAAEITRGTVLAGRYEIEAILGRGGTGVVLRAHDRELREAVAIKVLRPDLAGAARWIERLAREVKLARQLRHPNICRVFDFERADGHVFVVMELATGGTLRRELDEGVLAGRPLEARLADARAVAAGLAAIHEAGIAHRDVTPQNVLRMADGRLVVSDFGLATEVSQTTTSIHGGTIAYMAPEVVRGQRASFASDVWALGVVLHEIVFGVRPTWSKPAGGSLVAPPQGRALGRGGRLAFEVCRTCTAWAPERRPRSALEVVARLEGRRPRAAPGTARKRAAVVAALGLLTLVSTAALVYGHRTPGRSAIEADAFGFRQVPHRLADWARDSTLIAKFEGRVKCMTVLPDGHTVRVRWGRPPRMEDIDLQTGTRVPSPIVPTAFQESCPQISPDGKRLAFEGYGPDKGAFAFVSDHLDGRDAVPVVAIADPSVSSEPKWLPDSRSFTFDIDHQRMGLFSLDTRRTTVLPDATSRPFLSTIRFILGSQIILTAGLASPNDGEILELDWPSLAERARFAVPGMVLDAASRDGQAIFVVVSAFNGTEGLWKVDVGRHTRELLSTAHDGAIRFIAFTGAEFAYVTTTWSSDLWTRGASENFEQLTHSGNIIEAGPCRTGLIAIRMTGDGLDLLRLDRAGRVVEVLSSKTPEIEGACGPTEGTWYKARASEGGGIYRCGSGHCDLLTSESGHWLTVSPDGERIAFIRIRKAQPTVSWISTRGGEVHEVGPSDTICAPGWSSNRALWLSRRLGGQPTWIEVDADTLRETGRSVPGQRDCADADQDPASPVNPDLRVVVERRAELRTLPLSVLDQ